RPGPLLLRSGAILFALFRGRVDRAGPTRPSRAQLVALPRRAGPLAAALVLGQCGPGQEHHPSQGQRPDAGKAPSILHEFLSISKYSPPLNLNQERPAPWGQVVCQGPSRVPSWGPASPGDRRFLPGPGSGGPESDPGRRFFAQVSTPSGSPAKTASAPLPDRPGER